MKLYMLDTDISSYIIKSYSQSVSDRYNRVMSDVNKDVCISAITASELLYWCTQRPKVVERVTKFLNMIEIYDWGAQAADHYASIRGDLKKIGRIQDAHDMQIAAHARSIGATIVTNNNKHFSDVPGVLVENWVEGRAG